MQLTGERVIPEKMDRFNSLLLEHIGRYHLAVRYVKGRVLDIACGVGYGSFMMAKYRSKKVSEVVGVDCDPETIAYARQRYHHPRCSFYEDDALNPSLVDKHGQFDTIVSFETLEHLDDDRAFLQNLKTLLRPGGTLIVSTPLGAGRDFPSKQPFHNFQLTEEQFMDLFSDFRQTKFFHQQGLVFQPYREGASYPLILAVANS